MAKKKAKKRADGVPNKVAAQEAAAEELQRKLAAGEPLDGTNAASATDGDDAAAIAQAAASQTASDANNTTAADADAAAAAAAQEFPRVDPGSVEVVVPAANAQGDDGLKTLQDRFNVLEGKYNTEITRMQTALTASENVIQSQEALIKNLQSGAAAAPAAAANEPASNFKKLNPDDFASYGSEMESMVQTVNSLIEENGRLVTAAAATPASGTQGENDRLKIVEETVQRLGGTVQLSAKQTYYNNLDNAIQDQAGKPNWEAINHDPRFATWLGQEEPLTGIPRKNILLKANQDMNSVRVISIFSEFTRSLTGGTGQIPNGAASETGLSDMAVPGSAGGAGDGADVDPNAGQDVVTTEMFQKAKNDFVQGRIQEADFDKVSNGYQNSIAKGLIKPV